MKIAIVGAHCTGKTWLANALANEPGNAMDSAIESPMDGLRTISIHDALALNTASDFDLILLMGLDWQPGSGGHFNTEAREKEDNQIRAHLQSHGLDFTVVYGNPPTRLTTARCSLHAKYATVLVAASAFPEPIVAAISSKTGQKWNWECDKCSDPECEHRLFTALLEN
jgi:hypothetical protein